MELATRALNVSGTRRLSSAERAERGKEARHEVPRSTHAEFTPAADRSAPLDLLEHQASSRVSELVPIRYGRMTQSPFTFYRGGALIMAADLAHTPRSGFEVQVCGDAHVSNFGLFASPERRLVFDINDFDETLPGPWEWDVKRLAVSVLIAARSNGFGVTDQERLVLATVAEYRRWMVRFAGMRNLAVWYSRFEVEPLLEELSAQVGAKMSKLLRRRIKKTIRRDSRQASAKLTEIVHGESRIISQPPLVVPAHEFLDGDQYRVLAANLGRLLASYGATLQHDRRVLIDQFHLTDIARKVVGVGSVGTHAWIALLLGRDGDDPLVLQVKEAQPSVLEEFAGRSRYGNAGERVVAGQRLMQAVGDIFLGWLHVEQGVDGDPHDYYVRQLRDWKGSITVEAMNPRAMTVYVKLCGQTLARAHARTGDRIAIASYLGKGDMFDRAVLGFSEAYAEQNERDYRSVIQAIVEGQIQAVTAE